VAAVEAELEERVQSFEQDSTQLQHRSEEQIRSLKQVYELEKQALEQRLQEEKSKGSKMLKNFEEELTSKNRNEQAEKEEEIEELHH
jgi:hypothetical protein